MSVSSKASPFRGEIRAIAGGGASVYFITTHAEGAALPLYTTTYPDLRLITERHTDGWAAIVIDGPTAWAAGNDRRIYTRALDAKLFTAISPEFDGVPLALARPAGGVLAVLAASRVFIVSTTDGKVRQTLPLAEPGTSLALDPTGQWLVVGTERGTVIVFDREGKDEFVAGESAKLHEGAVTAFLFEPEELRFLSGGADGKLLSTHARGKLEPEDKGKGNAHTDRVTAILWGPADRLLTGSRDGTIKNWPRTGGAKPVTTKDDVGKVLGLTLIEADQRPVLVAACADNTLRYFPIDAAGKLGESSLRLHGAANWAKSGFTEDAKGREETLKTVALWEDAAGIELIADQAANDADSALRVMATEMLGASKHPRAVKPLEDLLKHKDSAVQLAALGGLRRHVGTTDLRPLTLALEAETPALGQAAVAELAGLANKDDQALALLTKCLTAKTSETRLAALTALERLAPADSPEADLTALASTYTDVRRVAMLRLLERGMLNLAEVQSALRRAAEDADAEIRRVAFLLSLYARPALLTALRARDAELDRQLVDLETTGKEAAAKQPKRTTAKTAEKLAPADHDPLLQATASRALDTCLRGARGLAVLGDERALGLLLQLSRERDAAARAEVARALGALDDPRSAGRLRSLLFDAEAAVRDAAFTALEKLSGDNPLQAADAALGASFDDVRRRGLQAVIASARKRLPTGASDAAWPLLIRALNDPSPAVRGEAFKAALNLKISGGGVNTLRFVLQSVHPDVRREVLTEAMAAVAEPWAWGLVLEFLNDPDAGLRGEAFDFATKRIKDLEPLQAALKSRYADTRRRAVGSLVKKHSKAAQAVLAGVLSDDDTDVRLAALDALIGDDVLDALRTALESPHDDVHARAARALARHGDPAALKPLVRLAAAPEPQGTELQAAWVQHVGIALDGLAELGDPAALPQVIPLLDSPHAKLREAAGWALAWVAGGHHPGSLRQAMQHADPQVKYQAALGVALGGDASAAPLVFSDEGVKVLPAKERLAAALALGPAGEDHLVEFLDHHDERTRTHALLLLMLLELKRPAGVPSRCLACLACREPRIRLRAARALDSFRDPALFLRFVKSLFDDRGEEKPWDIPATVVDAVAELIAYGPLAVQARTARLLSRLFKEEQSAWDRAWAVHEKRFAGESESLRKEAAQRKPAPGRYTAAQLEELAFGAYVGLVREQGGSYAAKAVAQMGPQIARVRQAAVNWVVELARRNAAFAGPARAVLVQALGDPNQPVRTLAFEQLQALGMDPTALAAESLGTGHVDLGVRGLELLSGSDKSGAAAEAGQAVLEQAMLRRTDDLAVEAAKLLRTRRSPVAVAGTALAAAHEPLREQAVDWLAEAYDDSAEAKQFLRSALTSRYAAVRLEAAYALAQHKDPTAFEELSRILIASRDVATQAQIAQGLQFLGDARAVDVILDRIEKDLTGSASHKHLFPVVASLGKPQHADRLLAMAQRDAKLRADALAVAKSISGYDQRIEDADDERPDRRWLESQRPRHDDVLAKIIERLLAMAVPAAQVLTYVYSARWAPGKQVDPVLRQIAAHPDELLRRVAVEAVGFRLRKRGGPAEPLLAALAHRDPTTQFFAAEGLARAGRGEGLSVLLSAVDYLDDLPLRHRAVRAVGQLADPRALDTLLRLANEEGHLLRAEAAEAIGHLGRSAQADDIFKLLERLDKAGNVGAQALRGLRWLGTPAAWQLIRRALEQPGYHSREVAAELLGDDDDPATRDLLLRVVATEDEFDVATAAFTSVRRLSGGQSLEPHYAWLQNPLSEDHEDGESLELLGNGGDAKRIFAILPKCSEAIQKALGTILLNRVNPPLAEAQAAIASTDPTTAEVAARVLGRAGAAAAKSGPALRSALEHWRKAWEEQRQRVAATDDDSKLAAITRAVQAMLWVAGRIGVAQDAVIAAAADVADVRYRPIRREAVSALATTKPTPAVLDALETAATGDDPATRALAADAIARLAPARAAGMAGRVLPDRVGFDRFARAMPKDPGIAAALRGAAGNVHYQGIALPHLAERGDVAGLLAAATDAKLPEATRLGAVEGLGLVANEAAEAKLAAIGKSEKESTELRKAAWRALRRSKRIRQKAAEATSAEARV